MSDILRAVFGSGGDTIVPAIKIASEGQETIPLTVGYYDIVAKDENGDDITYQKSGIKIGIPNVSSSGSDAVSFGIDNVTGEAQDFIWKAIEGRNPVELTLYTYLESDLSAPAEDPLTLQVTGGSIEASTVTFNAAYLDLMNIGYPRRVYETTTFPAMQYISKSSDI